MKKNERTRNWTFVLYPESMPEDYLEILNCEHCPVIISPLHNKDIDPTGEPKKEHYHILICYESVKSYSQVCELTDKLNATIPQVCKNTKGMVRYFLHLDNPEKAPYKKSNIRTLGYVDLEQFFELSFADKTLLLKECFDIINTNNIYEFYDFINYVMVFRPNDIFPLVTTGGCGFTVKEYLKSKKFKGNTLSGTFNANK